MYPMLHNASQSSMSEQKEMLNMNGPALTSNGELSLLWSGYEMIFAFFLFSF